VFDLGILRGRESTKPPLFSGALFLSLFFFFFFFFSFLRRFGSYFRDKIQISRNIPRGWPRDPFIWIYISEIYIYISLSLFNPEIGRRLLAFTRQGL